METKETNGNGHNKTVAIEIAKPTTSKAYEPRDYSEALQMAKTLAASNLLGGIKTTEQAFLIMAAGSELGIPPTAALRSIHVVSGKPVLSADLIVAVCLRSTACEYFTVIESTATQATYETKRRGAGQPVRNTFTIEDAKTAGLASKDNWKNYGKAMLRHRAAAELARMVYPDLVLGIYAEEEMIEAGPPSAPIETPRQQEVIDADVVTPAEPPTLARLTAAYLDAKTLEDVAKIDAEIGKLKPVGEERDGLLAMRGEAVKRIKEAA